jgi:hemerythrin
MHEEELVSWSKKFEGGLRVIDEQHKHLIELCNTLFNHCVGNEQSEKEFFRTVMHEAVKYIKEHFATEEKYMKVTKYPGLAEHKHEHDQFTLKVVDSVMTFKETGKLNLFELTKFLKNWILSHIAFVDQKMFAYFRSIATRKEDGKFSITNEDVKKGITN